jgi:hypothetical protein
MQRFPSTSILCLVLALGALLGGAPFSQAQETEVQEVHPIIYSLDFKKTGSSINFNFFDGGFVIGPYEGSALVGLGSFIFTNTNDGLKEYFLVEESAHMFIAKKGTGRRMVFGGGSIGEAGFSGYQGIGRPTTSLSVPGITLKIASTMKGKALAGADETSLVGTINEPSDGTLSLAGNLYVTASLRTGFTRQANAVEGAGSLADATQLVVDYLEDSGFVRSDPIDASIAATQDGDRFIGIDGEFTVSLTRTSATDSVINYDVGGSATSGTDFTPLSGSVTVPAGDTTATIAVPVIAATSAGDTETVTLTLSSITSGDELLSIDPNNDTATIDLTNGILASITASANGSRSGDTDGEFTVALSSVSITETIISYSVGGTAIEGADYTALTGEVTVPAESGAATIAVAVVPDPGADTTDTVIVTLDAVTTGDGVAIDSSSNEATVELIE